jgi:ribonuclease HI
VAIEVIKLDIWIDGCGFNGEWSRFAVFCQDGSCKIVDMACNQTADEMRQHSLLYALNHIAGDGDRIFTDSKPVISEGTHLLGGRDVKIEWVPKEENKAGRLLI